MGDVDVGGHRPLLLVLSIDSGLDFPSSGLGSVLKVDSLEIIMRNIDHDHFIPNLYIFILTYDYPGESPPRRGLVGERRSVYLSQPPVWHRARLGGGAKLSRSEPLELHHLGES